MQVFISWSGERSKDTAETLKKYLPLIVQAVSPVISTDIEKGTRWFSELSTTLDNTKFGICCLTQDNTASPWLLFEAGAMSKTKETRVWTFLLNIEYKQIEYPLAQFQHTEFKKDDFLKLIKSINDNIPAPERKLPDDALLASFEKFWPDLEAELKKIKEKEVLTSKPSRKTADMVSEILEISRKQDYSIEQLKRRIEECCKNIGGLSVYGKIPGPNPYALTLDTTHVEQMKDWTDYLLSNYDPDEIKKLLLANYDPDAMKKLSESLRANYSPEMMKNLSESIQASYDTEKLSKINNIMKLSDADKDLKIVDKEAKKVKKIIRVPESSTKRK